MISRNRSAPTATAMSIERTTSANSTVTCLYSAAVAADPLTGAPHSLQNLAVALTSVSHHPHTQCRRHHGIASAHFMCPSKPSDVAIAR
jgi:hypothetical protein